MRLSDKDIITALNAGKIGIEPRPDDSVITGVSVDLRLGNSFRVFKDHARPFVDVSASREEINSTLEAIMSEEIVIAEGESFFLLVTLRRFELSSISNPISHLLMNALEGDLTYPRNRML